MNGMDKAMLDGFRTVAIASIADALDKVTGRRGYMAEAMKNRINGKRMVGPAVTVLHAPTREFLPPQAALDAIDESPAGSVICIGMHGDIDVAVWGGLMSAGAFARKHAGAVLDAGVRDLAEIRRDYDLPIFARCVSPGTTLGRTRTIAAGIPVMVGGLLVTPGDIIVGDEDGVCVVPPDAAAEVLRLAQEIDAREAEQAKLIVASGSLREGLAKYGRI
jgi:regulator of RNase E activity RraA